MKYQKNSISRLPQQSAALNLMGFPMFCEVKYVYLSMYVGGGLMYGDLLW